MMRWSTMAAIAATCATCAGGCRDDAATSDADVARLGAKATAIAVEVRGLPSPATPIKQRVMSRDQLLTYLRKRFEEIDAARMFRETGRMLADFGVLEPDVDLAAAFENVALQQIAGYYDWKEKTLFVADWLPSVVQMPVLVHEATHALQDAHYGLGRFMDPVEGFEDGSAAVQCLVEGDATLVMFEAMMRDGHATPAERDKAFADLDEQLGLQATMIDAPPIIAKSMIFPYRAGLGFARYAKDRGGWPAVDALYTRLPLSTEQILHPERGLVHPIDYPQVVTAPLPAALSSGWEVTFRATQGEMGLRILFEEVLPPDAARRAADGWDGDTSMLLVRRLAEADDSVELLKVPAGTMPDGTLTLVASVWDSDADAQEAAAAFRAMPARPTALLVDGAKIVGLWGERVRDPDAVVRAVLDGMRLDEAHDFDALRRLVERSPAP